MCSRHSGILPGCNSFVHEGLGISAGWEDYEEPANGLCLPKPPRSLQCGRCTGEMPLYEEAVFVVGTAKVCLGENAVVGFMVNLTPWHQGSHMASCESSLF